MHHSLRGRLVAAGVAAALCGAGVANAQSFNAGPGTGIANEQVDTPATGGRINVDQGSPVTLQPGTYFATLFSYDAGQAGDVTPFLAVSAGGTDPTDLYTVVALGDTVNVAGAAPDQVGVFGPNATSTFTLGAQTVVYGGIVSQGNNPVFLDDGTGPNTDHEGTGQNYTVTFGGQVPPDGTFTNPNLGRSYAFSVAIELVPEPSTFALGAMGLGLLGCRLRRRR